MAAPPVPALSRRCRARPGAGPPAALLLAAGVWLAGAAHATADGPDHFRVRGVAADDVLNIRAEPDARSPKVGQIPPGAGCVRNLGCRGGLTLREFTELSPVQQRQRLRESPRWCRIEYGGVQGWVAGRYLEEGECPR